MTSPVAAVRAQVITTWEALTPPSRTSVTYHAVESRRRLMGDAGDRSFWFPLPTRLGAQGEAGVTASQVRWAVAPQLRLTQAGRSADDLFDAVVNEANLLARAIEKTSSWPANTLDVITGEVLAEIEETSGDALITFNLEILTSETD